MTVVNGPCAAPNGTSFACEVNSTLKTVIVSNTSALQVYLPGPALVCLVIIPDPRLLAVHPELRELVHTTEAAAVGSLSDLTALWSRQLPTQILARVSPSHHADATTAQCDGDYQLGWPVTVKCAENPQPQITRRGVHGQLKEGIDKRRRGKAPCILSVPPGVCEPVVPVYRISRVYAPYWLTKHARFASIELPLHLQREEFLPLMDTLFLRQGSQELRPLPAGRSMKSFVATFTYTTIKHVH